MMRILFWPALFLFFFILQGAISVFYTGWLACDLLFLAIYSKALLSGQLSGVLAGLGAGFLQDAMNPAVFGFHMLSRTIFGFCIGLTKEKIVKENVLYHITIISLSTICLRFLYWWIELLRTGSWDGISSYCWDSIGTVVGNAVLVVPVMAIVHYVDYLVHKDEVNY